MSEAKIAIRRWWYIMPIVFITYSLAYVDRSNFSFASAAGINEDLGITQGTSSLLGALFFLGYFFFQIPGTIYAERRSVRTLIFWCLILWGGFATLTGLVNNIPVLAAIRFALGVVEAAVMPAMLVYISHWFTRSERSRANTFLILGNPVTVLWMSVLSGYLIHAYGWREMFIFEGIPAVIWAVFWWFLVRDKPEQVNWLTQDEKNALAGQLAKEQEGIKAVHNYAEAFRSRNVILLCVQYFFWSIGVYGFVLWLPSILRAGMQMGMVEAGWLSSVPYLAATVSMILVSWLSDKMQDRKLFVWPLLLIAALAFFGSWVVSSEHFWLSYGLLVIAAAGMYAPYGPFFAIIPEMLPKNVAGGAMALINSLGALGSFFGSWFVGYLNGNTGSPEASFIFMSMSLLVSVGVMLMVKPERTSVKPVIA